MSCIRHEGGEEYLIHIRAMRSDVPPIIRLRHVLKQLLRTYEFRAVAIRDVTPALPMLLPGSQAASGEPGGAPTPIGPETSQDAAEAMPDG